MDRRRIEDDPKKIAEPLKNRADKAMDAIREVVETERKDEEEGRRGNGSGKAMEAIREIVRREKGK